MGPTAGHHQGSQDPPPQQRCICLSARDHSCGDSHFVLGNLEKEKSVCHLGTSWPGGPTTSTGPLFNGEFRLLILSNAVTDVVAILM